jgi:hypothetical protein
LPIEKFPNNLFDLDRAYSISKIRCESGKLLVLINLHLSAYTSDGTIADEQLKMLAEDMKKEFEAGNSDVSVLGAEFTPDEMSRIYEMRMKRQGLDSASPTVLSDNVAALKSAAAARETDIDKLIKAKLAENN